MVSSVLPVYRFDPALAFPELPHRVQSTRDAARPIASVALTLAYLFSGNKFRGLLAEATPDEIHEELLACCNFYNVDLERVGRWANSLLIHPKDTLPEDKLELIPRGFDQLGFKLHPYQIENAAWSAHRLGTVLAMGCGVGKSATATASAITAARSGQCSQQRCMIICPLNAMPQWKPYIRELQEVYEEVGLVSCDSLHKFTGLDRPIGGALIIDEVHKLKHQESQRTGRAHTVRCAFEWCVGLTGTMLHTGAEGVMSMLDLVCPGLSRFMDKWAFGDTFDCVIEKKVGRRTKHSLGIPPEAQHDYFADYLSRGVRSLSFESPEVANCITLPGQERLLEDTWIPPQWVLDLGYQSALTAEQEATNPVLWSPTTDYRYYLGALGVALMHERRDDARKEMWDLLGWDLSHVKDGDLHDEIKDWARVLENEDPVARAIHDEAVNKWLRWSRLPDFSAVVSACAREGAIDRVIVLETWEEGGNKYMTYRFKYAPGSSAEYPVPGPKIRWLEHWLDENPDEPIVVGTAALRSIRMVETLLEKKGVDYRLIRGGVGPKDREEFVDDFQDGKFRVMLLQQKAGSESVTLTNAAVTVLIDHDYSPLAYTQFLARTHRQGQTRPCHHVDLSFNAIQSCLVRNLMRGEAFDAKTRATIEREVQYETVAASFVTSYHLRSPPNKESPDDYPCYRRIPG